MAKGVMRPGFWPFTESEVKAFAGARDRLKILDARLRVADAAVACLESTEQSDYKKLKDAVAAYRKLEPK